MRARWPRLLLALALVAPAGAAANRPPKATPPPAPSPPPPDPNEELARSFYRTGIDLYERGDFAEAAKQFERALAKTPKQAAFMYNIASAYDKAGDRDKAAHWYRRYVESMPDGHEVGVARARADVLDREARELAEARAAAAAELASRPAAPPAPPPPPAPAPRRSPALTYVEPVTGASYPTWVELDGAYYTLVGAGARRVLGFTVYAMGLYVEEEPARKAFPKLAAQAGGADRESLRHSNLVDQFVVIGDFGKLAVLHFARDVAARDVQESYRDALDDAFGRGAPASLRADGEAFVKLFDEARRGKLLEIHTSPDGRVRVRSGAAASPWKLGPTNLRLVHDIWDIWLGPRPISTHLKKTILDRVDTLGR